MAPCCIKFFENVQYVNLWLAVGDAYCDLPCEKHEKTFTRNFELYAVIHHHNVETIRNDIHKFEKQVKTHHSKTTETRGVLIFEEQEKELYKLIRTIRQYNEKNSDYARIYAPTQHSVDTKYSKPIAKPRKVTPLMQAIWELPPELKEMIYKETTKQTLKDREERGWKNIHLEILDTFDDGIWCKEQEMKTKVWWHDNDLLCLACLSKNINLIHSFGSYKDNKIKFANHWYFGERIEKWMKKNIHPDLIYSYDVDEWFKKHGVTKNPLSIPYFVERLKQLSSVSTMKEMTPLKLYSTIRLKIRKNKGQIRITPIFDDDEE